MRTLLVILLLVPMVSAETVLNVAPHAPPGFTITPTVSVWGDDGIVGHQDIHVRFLQGDRLLWETRSLHEHDGIAPMLFTVEATTRIEVTADEQRIVEVTTGNEPPPGEGSLASMRTTTLVMEDGQLRVEKLDTRGVRGLWTVRDATGPVLTGWVSGHGQRTWEVATLHGDSTLNAEFYSIGRAGALTMRAIGEPAASMAELPTTQDLGLATCTDVHMDPEDVVAGNLVRIVAGNRAKLEGPPREQVYTYELRHLVDSGLRHELVYEWMSGGPIGQTSLRPPFPGDFELYVMRPQSDCKIAFTAQAGNAETIEPAWSFVQENDTLVFDLELPSSEHYEIPLQHRYSDGDITTSRLVWAGKLHSHGGRVGFTAAATPGNHTLVFDVSPQGADPVVVSPENGFLTTLQVLPADAAPTPDVPTPLPAALLIGALVYAARRRA